MAYIGTIVNESPLMALTAAEDITTCAFLAAKLDSSGITVAGAGDVPIGIMLPEQENIESGDTISVKVKDICRWTASAAIAAGAAVAAAADGKCRTAVAEDFIMGYALEAAAGAGVPILVQITKSGYVPAE